MKITASLALAAALALSSVPAHATKLDLSTMSCKQFVESDKDTIQLVLTGRVRRSSGPALGWVDFVDGVPQPLITVSVSEVSARVSSQ